MTTPYKPKFILDGKEVEKITAFLFHAGGHEDPKRLAANAGKRFQGSIVLGMGFTFDDSNPDATSIAEMQRLIESDPKNAERIFPYVGGEEVNSSPTHSHHRYVINFGEMTEDEARQYPDLIKIIEEKVKPERLKVKDKGAKEKWWLFIRTRPELQEAIAPLDRVLVISLTSKHFGFAFLRKGYVYDQTLIVFVISHFSFFTILSCRLHEIWSGFFGASLEDRPRYNVADCFETFPFPPNWENNPQLEAIGKEYYEYRAQLMIANNQGLTTTYNRFHDPDEFDSAILKLRELHNQMDRAVLDAYGWQDIQPLCEFLLDYEDEEEPNEENSNKRQKKKPYRYRWTDETRDEVLARLLALNEARYQEEVLRGDKEKVKGKKAKGGKKSASNTLPIPDL